VLLLRCKRFTQLTYHPAACGCQAVIGAGPCGLSVARELAKVGHSVTIFEAGDGVGGAWRFDEAATDSDLLGLESNRVRVHSSM
jgi:predicted NAD/FAD-binding protein